MAGLSFVPLGVGNAFSARHYTTCLAVESEGEWLLVECPHPIRKMMAEAHGALDVGDVTAVVVTHLHADHSSGLEGFAYYSRFELGRRVRLLAHPDVAADLWEHKLSAGMGRLMHPVTHAVTPMTFADYFDWTPLDEARAVTVGPFAIACRRTIHQLPTTALRLHAGGSTLAYSADTVYDRDLIDWLAEADWVLHETGLPPHTPYWRLAMLPRPIKAKLRLIHYPDGFDESSHAIPCLEQGRRYRVGSRPGQEAA